MQQANVPRPAETRGSVDNCVIQAWQDGATYRQIASLTGMSMSAVAQRLAAARTAGQDLPRRKAPLWSSHEDESIATLSTSSEPAEVAEVLGRSEGSVRRRARELRVTWGSAAPTWTPSLDTRLATAYRGEDTLDVIAEDLGVTVAQVMRRLDTLRARGEDIPQRKPRWTDTRREHLARRYQEGISLNQLEVEFERTRGTITYQLRTLRRLGYDLSRD